jgi:BASS family bile acid:Na+ symporter
MQSADNRPSARNDWASFLKRNCFWLLLACYALAALLPRPGQQLRSWRWTPTSLPATEITVPLVLLAVLLFCAAVQTDVAQIRAIRSRPWALLIGTIAVWIAPALLVVAAAWGLPLVVDANATSQLLVGLALVASMPVANSSVGWTQLVRGNLALSLSLVLVTIFLSPWVTPALLGALRFTLNPADQSNFTALIDNFSGAFFIIWVVLPTAAGLACRHSLGGQRVAALGNWLTAASVGSLLALNYANASLAFPAVFKQSQFPALAAAVGLALAVSAVGLVAGQIIARLLREDAPTRLALVFSLAMKHTGLALLLAGAVLSQQPLAILMIVLATLAQHLLAGFVEWRSSWANEG